MLMTMTSTTLMITTTTIKIGIRSKPLEGKLMGLIVQTFF